eukprot:TRINITY_DN61814_c0_g2_i1.p1 TRINITY_DN61814_c0_g2~~TRINITY_DN61814_c0_g2_i1.p1  ORF type:complete len:194 (+),score=29.88 TRINITY_DN61814_c0_g2_i1:111-692(+)
MGKDEACSGQGGDTPWNRKIQWERRIRIEEFWRHNRPKDPNCDAVQDGPVAGAAGLIPVRINFAPVVEDILRSGVRRTAAVDAGVGTPRRQVHLDGPHSARQSRPSQAKHAGTGCGLRRHLPEVKMEQRESRIPAQTALRQSEQPEASTQKHNDPVLRKQLKEERRKRREIEDECHRLRDQLAQAGSAVLSAR